MAKRLACFAPGVIGWQEVPERELVEDEVKIRPTHGVEKHGTMAAFVTGYANQRGAWDKAARIHRADGMLWSYPVPLGNMQFGSTPHGDRVAWWGPFQDECTVPASVLIRMGDVQWRDAAMLDPGIYAVGALRDGGVRIGDTVAVFGLGAIGLAAVQLARAAGATQVFAVDPIRSRRLVAERLGAIAIDPAATDAGLALREATDMRGVDVAIDFSGSAHALQSAFRGVGYGGTVAYGAFPAPFPAGLDLGGEFHMNRLRIVSTRAASDPNPDHPRWDEGRIVDTAWRLIQSGLLRGEGIVDDPVPFQNLDRIYAEIATHPDRHIKLAVSYDLSADVR